MTAKDPLPADVRRRLRQAIDRLAAAQDRRERVNLLLGDKLDDLEELRRMAAEPAEPAVAAGDDRAF